jgi:tripartite-type tricarboxylate transporter receptor subunit TctC
MVPAGTPRPIVDRLNTEVRKALANAEVRSKLAVQGAEPLGSTPEEYGAYIRKELDRWGKVVRESGVKAE